MHRPLPGLALFLAALAFASPCGVAAPATPEGDAKAVADANTAFAVDLYAKLAEGEGNLFLSPFSISTALAMTYAGARGQTAAQMAKALHFELDQEALHAALGTLARDVGGGEEERGYELSVANALWGQKDYGFLKPFLDLVERHYGAGLRQVDFKEATEPARQAINRWVEEQTRDKIKDLIPRGVLDGTTRMVLANAIYFKGKWASQFKPKRTQDEPFALLGGEKVTVPMMHQTQSFGYAETDDVQLLEMPYVGEEVSMVVLLPKKADGLPALEKALTAERLGEWLSGLHMRRTVVTLPRFSMTSQFSLSDTLRAMGMTDAFDADRADFTGMASSRPLFISAVLHKAFVDVNEEGTEAAAATGVAIGCAAAGPLTTFRADHPFLFLIRDKRTGSILFLGRVMNPTS